MLHGLDHAALLAQAARLVGRDQAEDVVQQTYIRLLETTSEFRGDAQYQTYAITVLRRIIIDAWRSAKPTEGSDAMTEPSATPNYDLALDIQRLDLTADERAVFALADHTQAEMARVLGWGQKGGKGRLARTLASLRAKLEPLR